MMKSHQVTLMHPQEKQIADPLAAAQYLLQFRERMEHGLVRPIGEVDPAETCIGFNMKDRTYVHHVVAFHCFQQDEETRYRHAGVFHAR